MALTYRMRQCRSQASTSGLGGSGLTVIANESYEQIVEAALNYAKAKSGTKVAR
jgi:hypothetical protein